MDRPLHAAGGHAHAGSGRGLGTPPLPLENLASTQPALALIGRFSQLRTELECQTGTRQPLGLCGASKRHCGEKSVWFRITECGDPPSLALHLHERRAPPSTRRSRSIDAGKTKKNEARWCRPTRASSQWWGIGILPDGGINTRPAALSMVRLQRSAAARVICLSSVKLLNLFFI